MRTKIKS